MNYLLRLFLVLVLVYSCWGQNTHRDKEMKPELIMDTIGVKAGMIIGEVGAGRGYANDIKNGVLESIEEKSENKKIENIITVLGETEDPLFPENELDMIVMMMVYHDLEEPVIFFKNLKKYLKPIIIINPITNKVE